jgi:hypothetical protein
MIMLFTAPHESGTLETCRRYLKMSVHRVPEVIGANDAIDPEEKSTWHTLSLGGA